MVIEGLTDYLALSGELANTSDVEVLVNGASVGKRHFGPRRWIRAAVADQGSGGAGGQRRPGDGAQERQRNHILVGGERVVLGGQAALPAGQAGAEHHARLLRAEEAAGQADRSDHVRPGAAERAGARGRHCGGAAGAERNATGSTCWPKIPIPAGTEFLAETGLYKLNNKPDWWADWFTRKEFHDDRAAFFNTDFSGRREYVYLLKVVNAGKFAISPAQAGPMYQSNVQTTTDPATLEVQP